MTTTPPASTAPSTAVQPAASVPPAEGPLVETRGLSKLFRVGSSRIAALNNVDLTVPRGSFTAIVGTSGSGKSTLLNMLAGLEKPTAGEVYVAGHPLHRFSEAQLVAYRRQQVGFIFQSFNLLPTLTALDNVALPLSFQGMPKARRRARARAVLTQLGLGQHLHHKPTQLSGGQQQRVGIARALAVNPTIVFADEPTGNLDSRTAERILTLFRNVIARYNQTWIMVTHDQHIASFADTVVSIGDGRITGIHTNTTPEPGARS